MDKKRVLICGATGFIGRNVVDRFRLSTNYEVRAVHHDEPPSVYLGVEWVYADLRNASDVKRVMRGVDIVIQLAATTSGAKDIVTRPYIHVTDNAVMNSLIFRESYEQEVEHVIFPSCTVMYKPSKSKQRESDWDASDEIYPTYFGVGKTKVYCEDMCEFYSRLGRTKYTAIRHSNVYGPYDKFDLDKCHVFAAMLRKVLESDTTLEVWGKGKAARDLLYIDDLVDCVELCLTKQESPFEVFNCGSGKAIPILNIAKEVMRLKKKKLQIVYDVTKPDIPTTVVVDCSKAKRVLGWSPSVGFKDGIKRTLKWYESNRETSYRI
jgi:GDP-L-fucose synthase